MLLVVWKFLDDIVLLVFNFISSLKLSYVGGIFVLCLRFVGRLKYWVFLGKLYCVVKKWEGLKFFFVV